MQAILTKSGTYEWIQIRRQLGQQVVKRFLSHNNFTSLDPQELSMKYYDTSNDVTASITLAITTCKRLEVFFRTMSSLLESLGPLPNSLITEVIIIDDNSTFDDRTKMMVSYPNFTFVFKSFKDRGHAASMNYLYRMVNTKYLLYLEDDWLLRNQIVPPQSQWSKTMKLNRKLYANRLDIYPSQAYSHVSFYTILLSSLTILGFEGLVVVPTFDFSSSETFDIAVLKDSTMEKIHQVLFNEQSSRACAEGRDDCDLRSIGYGGWERSANLKINSSIDNFEIPFALHEFGILSSNLLSSRLHTFSDWPGFSFNPGLLDFDYIRKTLFDVVKGQGHYFRTDLKHHSFEQLFSAILYSRGMNMAYLPLQCFSHIGSNLSAYDLMGQDRKWQEMITRTQDKD